MSSDQEDFFDDDMEDPITSEEESSDEDAHSSSFSPILPEKSARKPYQIEYAVKSTADLQALQDSLISQMSSLLGCTQSISATLLRYFKWNKEKLIETYLEDPDGVSQAAGVLMDNTKRPKFVKLEGFVCDICCDEGPHLESLSLACGHRFCRNCYEEYLVRKITKEGESRKIQCPSNCSLVVDEGTIEMVVPPEVFKK